MLPQTIRRRALWCSAVVSRSDRVACLVRRPPSTGRISFPAASTPRAVSMSSHTVSGSGGRCGAGRRCSWSSLMVSSFGPGSGRRRGRSCARVVLRVVGRPGLVTLLLPRRWWWPAGGRWRQRRQGRHARPGQWFPAGLELRRGGGWHQPLRRPTLWGGWS